jgi:hypothetical protein
MDLLLIKFAPELNFPYNRRIIDLLRSHDVEHTYDIEVFMIFIPTESFVTKIIVNNDIDTFMAIGDIVQKLYDTFPDCDYYKYLARLIMSFGNLEMIESLFTKINLSILSSYHFVIVGYRFDDNVEIVASIFNKLKDGGYQSLYSRIAYNAVTANNINIFKYVYEYTLIDGKPQIESFNLIKRCIIWENPSNQFLEFFLSKSVLSESDILNGIKLVNNKDKIDVVLSYVDSGRLKLSDKTIRSLNEAIDKKISNRTIP